MLQLFFSMVLHTFHLALLTVYNKKLHFLNHSANLYIQLDLKKIKELDPDDKEILYKLPRIE